MSLTKLIVNCETGEYNEVLLTAEEVAEREAMAAEAEALRLAEEQALQAKADALASAQAKLAALGLTSEEITALLK